MSRLNSAISADTLKAVFGYMNDRYGRVHVVVHENNTINEPSRKALVPFIQNGTLILNIGGYAVKHLVIDPDGLSFEARFNGTPMHCHFRHEELLGVLDFDSNLIVLTNVLLGSRLDGVAYSIELKDSDEEAADGIEPLSENTQGVSVVQEGNVIQVDFGKRK